jgi:hypothetical protein
MTTALVIALVAIIMLITVLWYRSDVGFSREVERLEGVVRGLAGDLTKARREVDAGRELEMARGGRVVRVDTTWARWN